MTRRRYIITGPDGSGKSTLTEQLVTQTGVDLIYLGKRRASGLLFNMASKLRAATARIPVVSYLTRMLFFAIELADLSRLERRDAHHFYIAERHYIDRVAYYFQLKLSSTGTFKRRLRFLLEAPCLYPLLWVYFRQFGSKTRLRIILADPGILFERKQTDYASLAEAKVRHRAYHLTCAWWIARGGDCTILTNNTRDDLDALVSRETNTLRSLQSAFS